MNCSPLSNKPSRWLAPSTGITSSCNASVIAANLTWDNNNGSEDLIRDNQCNTNWSGLMRNHATADNAIFGAKGVGFFTLTGDIVTGKIIFTTALKTSTNMLMGFGLAAFYWVTRQREKAKHFSVKKD